MKHGFKLGRKIQVFMTFNCHGRVRPAGAPHGFSMPNSRVSQINPNRKQKNACFAAWAKQAAIVLERDAFELLGA